MSTHINAEKGQIAESVLLPGDPLRAKFIAENFLTGAKCYNELRGMYGYTGTYHGVPVSVQGTGMGMPSMGIYSWELITEYGCRNLMRIGSAGSFQPDIHIRDIVAGISASTDSNFHHAFNLPWNYAPCCSFELLKKLQKASEKTGIEFHAGNMLSSDTFYGAEPDRWKRWASMNVLAVEMEAAALYITAAHHRANALAVVTISDHMPTGEKLPAIDREKTFTEMMELSLEAVIA